MIDSADRMFDRSLELAYQLKDTSNVAIILNLQANTLITVDKYGLARQKLNRVMGEIIGTFNLGNTLILLGAYEAANTALNQVYDWSTEYGIAEGQIRSLQGLAENEAKHHHYTKAKTYFKNVLQLSREEGDFEFQKELLFQLGELVLKESNTDTIDYLSAYKVISDSIAGRKTRDKLLELETTYNLEKKEAEIALLQKSNLLKRTQIWLLLVASFLGILTTIFIIISYRRRQYELRQKNLLSEEKNRTQQLTLVQAEKDARIQTGEKEKAVLKLKLNEQEIIFNTLTYAKLVNAYHEVIDKFNAFTPRFRSKGDREDYRKLLHNMESANNINPLDEFERVFSSVHPGFYTRLIEKHPDLTPRELLFCAFIRLNMQTKYIALITNMAINSLEVARYRIRKKMNLSTDQNLTAELMKV